MCKSSHLSRTLARPASAEQPKKPLILLCDGTWCGREANTKTNIYKLARLIGIEDPNDTDQDMIPGRACYTHGVGLGSSFLEYVPIILSLFPYDTCDDNTLLKWPLMSQLYLWWNHCTRHRRSVHCNLQVHRLELCVPRPRDLDVRPLPGCISSEKCSWDDQQLWNHQTGETLKWWYRRAGNRYAMQTSLSYLPLTLSYQ